MIYGIIIIFGLIIGSFLNVVIYRLPLILSAAWENEARDILHLPHPKNNKQFNLNWPRSHCPQCKVQLSWYENIPVGSYLLQGGRCRHCRGKISQQYPLLEIITALIFTVLYRVYGLTPILAAGFILASALLVLTVIDFKEQLLPDIITIPLLWAGIIFSLAAVLPVTLESSVAGALSGYLTFWLLFHGYRYLTGKEGLGYGDFKLFAALGAWFGAEKLPGLLIAATLFGLLTALCFRVKKESPLPFGPALAAAGLLCLAGGGSLSFSNLFY